MLGTRTLTAGPIAVMILVRLPDQYPRRNLYIFRFARRFRTFSRHVANESLRKSTARDFRLDSEGALRRKTLVQFRNVVRDRSASAARISLFAMQIRRQVHVFDACESVERYQLPI